MELALINRVLIKGIIMTVIRKKTTYFMVVAAVLLISFYYLTGIAFAQAGSGITIDENLKPGMALKDAIELLGPPEKVKISDIGTVIMSYDNIGLSLEVLSDSTIVEAIHLQKGFKGRLASDTTKSEKRFEEKVTGNSEANVAKSITEKVAEQSVEKKDDDYYDEEEVEEPKEPEIDVFVMYGFKVKQEYSRVVVSEVTPGSFAEEAGLKVGEPIRKVFYKKSSERNIYAISGLKSILKRAVEKRRKFVNILQSKNFYIKMKVPRVYTKR